MMLTQISYVKPVLAGMLLFLFPKFTFSQDTQADSLLQIVESAVQDTSRWNALKNLSDYYYERTPAESLPYVRKMLQLGQKLGAPYEANALIDLGKVYLRLNEPDTVQLYAQRALEKSRQNRDVELEGRSMTLLGTAYEKFGEKTKALEIYREAMPKISTWKDSVVVLNNMALVCGFLDKVDESLAYYLTAYDIAKREQQKRYMAVILGNTSDVFNRMGRVEEAIDRIEKAIEIKEEINDDRGLLYSYSQMSRLLVRAGDPDKAEVFSIKVLDKARELNDIYILGLELSRMVHVMIETGRYPEAKLYIKEGVETIPDDRKDSKVNKANLLLSAAVLANIEGRYKEAAAYAEGADKLLPEEELGSRASIGREKMRAYTMLGDKYAAAQAVDDYISYSEQYYMLEQSESVAEIDAKYQTAEKEKQIALLEKDQALKDAEINRRKSQVALLSLIPILLIAFGGLFYFRYRYRQRLKLEQMRTRIASDLHDEVGSSLTHLNFLIHALDVPEEQSQAKQNLEKGKEIVLKAASNIRDVVWAIDARRDKAGDLLDRMEDFAYDMLSNRDIAYQFSAEGIDREEMINPFIRQNVYLIYKEAINNIVKHSSADQVDIKLKRSGTDLQMTITDNGQNLNESKVKGQGLENMQLRARRIGGTLEIDPGTSGFSVLLLAPLSGK